MASSAPVSGAAAIQANYEDRVPRGRAIPFQVTQSRGNYQSFQCWRVREAVIGIFSLLLLTIGIWWHSHSASLSRLIHYDLTRLSNHIRNSFIAVGTLLFVRTFLCVEMGHRSIYAVRGYDPAWGALQSVPAAPYRQAWDAENYQRCFVGYYADRDNRRNGIAPIHHLLITALDGTPVNARLLPGVGEVNGNPTPHAGKLIIFCNNSGDLYERTSPVSYQRWNDAGYFVMVYHPPGYGLTPGRRTPHNDYLALEAIIQHCIAPPEEGGLGFSESAITLLGQCLGSGAAVEMATKYQINRLHLVEPFASLDSIPPRFCGGRPLGWFTRLFTDFIMRDYYGYDNVSKMRQLRARNITLDDSASDGFMTLGSLQPEGDRLIEAFHRAFGRGPAPVSDWTPPELPTPPSLPVRVTKLSYPPDTTFTRRQHFWFWRLPSPHAAAPVLYPRCHGAMWPHTNPEAHLLHSGTS